MLFKIKDIGDDGLSLDLPITPVWLTEQCPGLDLVPGLGGLRVRGQLLMSEDQVFLRGTLRGTLEGTCGRCLEKARVSVDVPLTVTFIERDDEEDDDDEATDGENEDNLDVATYEGDEIDLGPEIRDQLLLALPLIAVCREDCAGLCPVCGGNRNQVACDCRMAESPARTPLANALGKIKL